jgi:hypothetical protein
MTPINLMIEGGVIFLVFVLFDVINLNSVAKGNANYSVVGFFHVVFTIFASIGGVGFILGLLMFLIDYAKHA